jgi:hypothetical protein
MTYLPVARACAQARDVYFMRSEAMRDHVSEIYEAHKMRPSGSVAKIGGSQR